MNRSALYAACAAVAMSALPASAQDWKRIELRQSPLVVAIDELDGVKPIAAQRGTGLQMRGSLAGRSDADFFAIEGHDLRAWILYDVSEANVAGWVPEAPSITALAFTAFRGKQLSSMRDEQTYKRPDMEGRYAFFTYRSGGKETGCMAGGMYSLASLPVEQIRVSACVADGNPMSPETAQRIMDGLGTKLRPPVIAGLSVPNAPLTSVTPADIPAPAGRTAAERLRTLKELLTEGLITEAEHEQKRKEILDGL